MSSSPLSSADAARKSIAKRLRELRLDAGLTTQGLADRCQWSKSKTSRIETIKTNPSDADIRSWCEACEAQDQAADLIAASRGAESMYVEWRRLQRTGLRRLQESTVPLYERTERFRVYCSRVVPGTLQTEGYAYALLSSIAAFRGIPDDAQEAARARVERSKVLHRRGHSFAFLIEEDVLYYRHGDARTMAAQLGHLATVTGLPNVSLGVIPRTAPRAMWGQETFTMFDDSQVHVELLTARVTVSQPSEVLTYARAFAALSKMAVHGAEARSMISAAIDSLG
ncbi:helix-turn-helix transcriptional regulator [Streptomyces sp. NPDC020719]|uniref:helix-turn-helix domain-containing protein n=1 Tax=Streptomyces sp. NPDC020719 TaxID=3154896 RepID=UPI0033E6F1BE